MLPLTLTELTYSASGRVLVDRVTARIEAGSRSVILGPNGAGKSVLMRLCHGLLTPSAGSIAWRAPGIGRQAMVFQRPVMLRRSALANVAYVLKLAGLGRTERATRARHAMVRAGVPHLAGHAARVLSGGEQQRVALARAWALEPQVLFLDEPTANLDPSATREVEALIDAIHAGGTKIIMSTHNLAQARRLADEILFLHGGRLIERADAGEFFSRPRSAEASAFIEGELPWH
jgi:tungstate transport system ATP-binding protein